MQIFPLLCSSLILLKYLTLFLGWEKVQACMYVLEWPDGEAGKQSWHTQNCSQNEGWECDGDQWCFAAQLVNGLGHPAFSSNSTRPQNHSMNAVDPASAYLCRLQLQFFKLYKNIQIKKKLHKAPESTSSHAGSSFRDKYLARDTKTYLFSCILLLQPWLRPRSLFPDVHISVPKDFYHAQVPV